jgi:hypothetical protein
MTGSCFPPLPSSPLQVKSGPFSAPAKTPRDVEALTAYLSEHAPQAWTEVQVKAAVYQGLRVLAVKPPTSKPLDRIIASAAHTLEERFWVATLPQLVVRPFPKAKSAEEL